jgi:hypothetical protein
MDAENMQPVSKKQWILYSAKIIANMSLMAHYPLNGNTNDISGNNLHKRTRSRYR